MNKKKIITAAALALFSFTAAFLFAWLTAPAPSDPADQTDEQTLFADYDADLQLPPPKASAAAGPTQARTRKTMTDKQLKSLIYEVREKILEYDDKLQTLEVREQRLQRAQEMLKKDINDLNNLRVELASVVAGLKEQQEILRQSRVRIAEAEKNNLVSMAAAYDKMDPSSAGQILTNMSRMQDGRLGGANLNDAVKILHYMSERTKAKLLAELVGSEPKLAAVFCQKLKEIVEEN